jgi:glycosyltransferase involved in cell wall biosynthesis
LADFEDIAKTWNDEQPLHFGCVGRLMAIEKGQDTLLAALSAPIWRDRPFKLSFYGSGPDLNYFQELARFYGLENKISFRGQMQNIQEAWREVHIAVVPSNFEGVPQAMLEAMLCARPVVATAVGGIPEWLEEGRGGFLAEAPTPRYLANALERAWENRHRWREIGEAARAACLEMLDPDPAGRLLGLLETAAAAAEN